MGLLEIIVDGGQELLFLTFFIAIFPKAKVISLNVLIFQDWTFACTIPVEGGCIFDRKGSLGRIRTRISIKLEPAVCSPRLPSLGSPAAWL